jgi:hypothetical protein
LSRERFLLKRLLCRYQTLPKRSLSVVAALALALLERQVVHLGR